MEIFSDANEKEKRKKKKKKKKNKGLHVSKLALLLVLFKSHRGSERVKDDVTLNCSLNKST